MKKLNKLAGIFATITILLFSLFSTPKSAGASCAPNHIIYVASSGSGAGGCTWATAFPLLQDAITLATSGDQIWVASGTYYPDEGAGQINNDRNSTFTLKNGVSVYGGFSVGDALLTDRDSNPATNGTVLSGDIDQVAGNANNAYTVVTTNGFLADTYVLDGFTITGGNQNSGSGVGGGMYIQNTSPTLANLIITANNANGRGGGVFIISVSAVEANYSNTSFTDVTVSNNTAGIGGGVYVQNGSPSFTRVTFTGNSSASGAGGGLNVQTLGGPGVDEPNLPTLLDVVFTSNTSVGGGGMFNNNSQSTLNRVTFSGNTATRRGGGMLNEFSSPTLTNVTFSGNISTETSAATTPWGGGGIMNIGADPVLNNVTFNGNNSVNGSGTAGGDAIKNVTQTGNASAPVIENSILWGDGGINDEVRSEGTSSATIEDSIVQGGCPALATCTNVINSNPVLSALANNGGYTQTMAISVTGAADDAADTTTADCAAVDQRGTARPLGVACDIGAYEIDDTGAPTLISFTRFNPATTPTNADTLVFRATFSETVLNVSAGDFQVNGTTTATVTLITPVSGTVYEITVSGGDLAGFNGVVGIDLSGAQNITDSVGNALPAGEPATDETYTLDNNAPALQSFTRFNPLTSPTNADTLVFRATFNETVLNVSAGDFAVNGATTATVTLVTAISGTVYEITVSGGDLAGFNGVVGIDLSGAQDITDSVGNALPAGEPATDETFIVDNSGPIVTASVPANTATVTGPTQLTVTYNEDVKNDASAGAANNIVNYLLVEAGANATFDTLSCVGGVVADDTVITINTATYTNNGGSGPFIATLDINGGIALPVGTYQLYVCGTTSIENLINLELNDGLADTIIQFTVIAGGAGGGGGGGSAPANQRSTVPATGFPQGILTTLPLQPAEKAYTATSLWIEIPRLGVKMNIVGIPQTKDGWDVTWLARDAGWLNGSAFPTWQGNSVLTGHVWTETNKPGPFNKLKDLQYGDQVKIHAFGQVFIYEIRESALISSTDTKSMMKHEEKTWLTLITCEGFNAKTGDYLYRRMARAVLVSVIADQ